MGRRGNGDQPSRPEYGERASYIYHADLERFFLAEIVHGPDEKHRRIVGDIRRKIANAVIRGDRHTEPQNRLPDREGLSLKVPPGPKQHDDHQCQRTDQIGRVVFFGAERDRGHDVTGKECEKQDQLAAVDKDVGNVDRCSSHWRAPRRAMDRAKLGGGRRPRLRPTWRVAGLVCPVVQSYPRCGWRP